MTAVVVILIASGCNWKRAGLAVLAANGIDVVDVSNHDEGNGCDKWYDVADPDCY